MRNTLSQLIEVSIDLKNHFQVSSFVLNVYEDGSYSDFKVIKVNRIPAMMDLLNGHEVSILSDDGFLLVRVYEKEYSDE